MDTQITATFEHYVITHTQKNQSIKVDERRNPCETNNLQELESKMARTTVQMKMTTTTIILQTTRRDVLPLQKNNTIIS